MKSRNRTSRAHLGRRQQSLSRWSKYKLLEQIWEHKYNVEENIRNSGFRYWTILHPRWFMENFVEPLATYKLKNGILFGTMKGKPS